MSEDPLCEDEDEDAGKEPVRVTSLCRGSGSLISTTVEVTATVY